VGFVVGALVSAILGLADRVSSPVLFAASAVLAACCTAAIPLLGVSLSAALVMRLLTGFFLAGVYPVGMKIMTTWTRENRGFGVGLLVGALTLGSAAPHLIKATGGFGRWEWVLYAAAGCAALGGLIALLFVREGPFLSTGQPFQWRLLVQAFRQRGVRLANLGYLGHMWELYAVWTWLPIFLLAGDHEAGLSPRQASLAAFAVVGAGGLGSLVAGLLADRVGRTTVTITSLVVSGACCLLAGTVARTQPGLLVGLCLIWGFAVVADSAQFSAAISELCPPAVAGTALTAQTSMGFLLTLVTIRLVPALASRVGWAWALASLSLGPMVGIWAMATLRRLPEATRLAAGHR
jgi:MFS family permease